MQGQDFLYDKWKHHNEMGKNYENAFLQFLLISLRFSPISFCISAYYAKIFRDPFILGIRPGQQLKLEFPSIFIHRDES